MTEDADIEITSQLPEQQSNNNLRGQMRRGTSADILGRSYDSNQLDALFDTNSEFDPTGNGRIENMGMTATTPNINKLQNLENESTVHRIVELLKNG